jgi:nitrogen fixation protein FixH
MIQAQPNRYRWIPWVFVAAMGLVVAVNGGLVYFATREPVGIVVKNPYQDGLRYNETLKERRQQAALGWQIAAGVLGESGTSPVEVRVEAKDADGRPLLYLQGRIVFERPVEKLPPIEGELAAIGSGNYVGAAALPRAGQWDLTIEFTDGTRRHSSSTRVTVK